MREEKELFTGSYLQQVLEILTEILLQPPSYEPHPPPPQPYKCLWIEIEFTKFMSAPVELEFKPKNIPQSQIT